MESQRTTRPCCFDLKIGTKIILGVELAIFIIVLFSTITTLIESTNRHIIEESVVYLILSLLLLLCNSVGLFGIKQRNPTWLIPTIVCRILAFLFLMWSLIEAFLYVGTLIFIFGGVILIIVMWIFYSALIVFLCYKEMKEDLNLIRPSANGEPYNLFVNQPV